MRIGPQPGKQELFLSTPADIAIYGGRRGGGKSVGILLDPIRHKDNPGFRAVYFRRTTKDLTKGGGLWDTSYKFFPHLDGRPRQQPNLDWTFPSGAQLQFSHLEREADKENHRGNQYAVIYFDELPQFTETQFLFMLSCNRSTCGVRPYVRATCNPRPGWVKKLIRWWLDDEGRFAREDRAGVLRWFVRARGGEMKEDGNRAEPDEMVFANSIDELRELAPKHFVDGNGGPLAPQTVALSLTFIPAKLEDNPLLMEADPGYRAKMAMQQLVDRARDMDGDWLIREAAGNMFRGAWFPIVDHVEPYVRIVRFWDLAGSKRRRSDFLAGTKMAVHEDGTYTILDIRNEQLTPLGVETALKGTAVGDRVETEVHIEQETGASGELLIDGYSRKELRGFSVTGHTVRNKGSKVDRARPLSSSAEKGHVKLLRGDWNEPFVEQAEAFPDGDHDDMIDSTSGAHSALQDEEVVVASGRMGRR